MLTLLEPSKESIALIKSSVLESLPYEMRKLLLERSNTFAGEGHSNVPAIIRNTTKTRTSNKRRATIKSKRSYSDSDDEISDF